MGRAVGSLTARGTTACPWQHRLIHGMTQASCERDFLGPFMQSHHSRTPGGSVERASTRQNRVGGGLQVCDSVWTSISEHIP
jgi:hypothetical protein